MTADHFIYSVIFAPRLRDWNSSLCILYDCSQRRELQATTSTAETSFMISIRDL